MKKAILALAAVATIAVGTLATPNTADARCRGCGVAAGVLGGLAAGAIIGGAIASQPHYYGPRGYVVYDYDAPPPRECDGYWARRRLHDRYGNFIGWSRPHWFCRY